jgi:hypothetical protein
VQFPFIGARVWHTLPSIAPVEMDGHRAYCHLPLHLLELDLDGAQGDGGVLLLHLIIYPCGRPWHCPEVQEGDGAGAPVPAPR